MHCVDIAQVLDDGELADLSAAERAGLDAHLAWCPACAAEWHASEALCSFRADTPPLPPALEQRARQLDEIRASAVRERRSRRPLIFGGLLLLGASATLFATLPFGDASAAEPQAPPPC